MLRKRLIIASLIIALVCVCSITGYPLKRAQAATVTNHWTWSFPDDGLTYEVYEYSDCRFTVAESCGGAVIRTIVGHPYLTYVGDPRAAVDTATLAYWQQVNQEYHNSQVQDALDALIATGAIVMAISSSGSFLAFLRSYMANIAELVVTIVHQSRSSHQLPGDQTKVFYEAAVCSKAACDLARTPGITIPTETVPPVGA